MIADVKNELKELIATGKKMANMHVLYVELNGPPLYGSMDVVEDISDDRKEARLKKIKELRAQLKNCISTSDGAYEIWYTTAREHVKRWMPDRLSEFEELYTGPKKKPKTPTYASLGARDIIGGSRLSHRFSDDHPEVRANTTAVVLIRQQVNMLAAMVNLLDAKIAHFTDFVHASIFSRELDAASALLKGGHVRAAGVLCGVVLEAHLRQMCVGRGITTSPKATLSTFVSALQSATLPIQVKDVHLLNWCGNIRNGCAHKGSKEPDKVDVQKLISETDRIIKTLT